MFFFSSWNTSDRVNGKFDVHPFVFISSLNLHFSEKRVRPVGFIGNERENEQVIKMGSSKCFRFTQWELKQRCEQCWKIFGVWSQIEAHPSRLFLWKAPCWPYVAQEHLYVTKDHGGKPLRGLELATNLAGLTCVGQLGMVISHKRPWTQTSLNQPNSLPIIVQSWTNQPWGSSSSSFKTRKVWTDHEIILAF